MSAATFTPASGPAWHGPLAGASALEDRHHRHLLGDAPHAVKVFATVAFDVIVLGEYGEEAGVRSRR